MKPRVNLPPDYDAMSKALLNATTTMEAVSAWAEIETYEEFIRAQMMMQEVHMELETIYHVIRLTAAQNDHGTEGFIQTMQFAMAQPLKMLADTIQRHEECVRIACEMEEKAEGMEEGTRREAAMTIRDARMDAAVRGLRNSGPLILARIRTFGKIADEMLREGGPMDVIVGDAMKYVSEDWSRVGEDLQPAECSVESEHEISVHEEQ